jgi:DnaJ-class molecular chaperone
MDEDFFADFNSFFGDTGRQQSRVARGSDIFLQMDLEFMESVTGVRKKIQIEKLGKYT